MNDQTTSQLERALRAGDPEILDSSTLSSIRRRGARRRAARRALGVGSAVVAVAVVGLVTLTATGPSERGGEGAPAARDRGQASSGPTALSPLAERALREVPGARQVSDWQVVLPAPAARSQYWHESPDRRVVGETVPLGTRSYHGVTMFPAGAWPAWLYEGTLSHEESQKGDDGGVPVGSTDTGVLVDVGAAELVCVSWEEGPCGPALMTRTDDGRLHYEFGMGTVEFLTPGSGMEVFLSDDYSTGSAGELALAGLPGTDVARVDFVTTTGQVVPGRVHLGLVDGASMMSARVPGALARVTAYDAADEVLEDHPLKDCDSPVECEVR